MAPKEDPDLSFWVVMASITMSLNLGLPEELPFPLALVFFAIVTEGALAAAGASTWAWSADDMVQFARIAGE